MWNLETPHAVFVCDQQDMLVYNLKLFFEDKIIDKPHECIFPTRSQNGPAVFIFVVRS